VQSEPKPNTARGLARETRFEPTSAPVPRCSRLPIRRNEAVNSAVFHQTSRVIAATLGFSLALFLIPDASACQTKHTKNHVTYYGKYRLTHREAGENAKRADPPGDLLRSSDHVESLGQY